MSSVTQLPRHEVSIRALPLEEFRGIYAMWCVIVTECSLFACLFAAYFYLGTGEERWRVDHPPKMLLAFIMLGLLLLSSAVLHWGELQIKRQRYGSGRLMLAITILMGLAFMALQAYEYVDHWKTLTPYSDSYGSIFYTITSFHAAHLILGLLMLSYVLILPRYAPARESPFRPYQTAALYWHFVDFVWIFIVIILYVLPNVIAHG
jgi:heme/copper-type cytochrome/quinol oxidase subunit 3